MKPSPKTCSCCGQTLPSPLPPFGVALSPMQTRIIQLVHRAGRYGILSDDLFEQLYYHRRDGGPASGKWAMYNNILHLNRKLKPVKLRITAPPGHRSQPTNYVLLRD